MSTVLIRSFTSQSSSYPIFLTRLGESRSRPNQHLKLCKCRESNQRPSDMLSSGPTRRSNTCIKSVHFFVKAKLCSLLLIVIHPSKIIKEVIRLNFSVSNIGTGFSLHLSSPYIQHSYITPQYNTYT